MILSDDDKNAIRSYSASLGFDACGFARAEEISAEEQIRYTNWIVDNRNGSLQYMERYADVRANPQKLLEGARTVIATAMNYYPSRFQPSDAPQFAYYAYGRDYHEVVRTRLWALAAFIKEAHGGDFRVCVDTAPLRERYWAQQAGIGFVGRNNQLILPGRGSYFFLGFIITTVELPADEPCRLSCDGCGRCVAQCPAHALDNEGAVDARRCLSCLSIEYRGELPPNLSLGPRVYGCDTCQQVCPHNRDAVGSCIDDFAPSNDFLALNHDAIAQMSPGEFRRMFRHSAVSRVSLEMLKRNLRHCSR
ncbi:MAG: tRNA epoxyqueuosine(34) reductase QueG [Muribaculaceae bacterium]